jgi:hypothetical protein
MQPDNKRIVELIAQTETQLRQLLIDIINAGATPPTIDAIIQTLNCISHSYFRAENQGLVGADPLSSPTPRTNLSEPEVKEIALESLSDVLNGNPT